MLMGVRIRKNEGLDTDCCLGFASVRLRNSVHLCVGVGVGCVLCVLSALHLISSFAIKDWEDAVVWFCYSG